MPWVISNLFRKNSGDIVSPVRHVALKDAQQLKSGVNSSKVPPVTGSSRAHEPRLRTDSGGSEKEYVKSRDRSEILPTAATFSYGSHGGKADETSCNGVSLHSDVRPPSGECDCDGPDVVKIGLRSEGLVCGRFRHNSGGDEGSACRTRKCHRTQTSSAETRTVVLPVCPPSKDCPENLQLQFDDTSRPHSILVSRAEGDRLQELHKGDRIVQVDDCLVKRDNWLHLDSLIRKAQPVRLLVQRGLAHGTTNKLKSDNKSLLAESRLRSRSVSASGARSRSASLPRSHTVAADELDSGWESNWTASETGSKQELLRALSYRHEHRGHRAFPPCDLIELDEIGKGTYGIAYKVAHRQTGEIMTMKKLYRFDQVAQEDFLRESAVLRNVEHENVLRFIGVMIKEQKLHIITEYVAGGTLEDRIKNQEEEFSWSDRVRAGRDIAAGLTHLHLLGIVHRDLKVDNCLIRQDGSVVVADFGLSCILQKVSRPGSRNAHRSSLGVGDENDSDLDLALGSSTSGSSRRRPSRGPKRQTVCGNAFCMAPEMLTHSYDQRVDIFSFAIILLQMMGRIASDPETGVPRSQDFGLDTGKIEATLVTPDTPPLYVSLAFLCGQVNPDRRPPFHLLHSWLNRILLSLQAKLPVSQELHSEVDHFAGESGDGVVNGHVFLRAASEPYLDLDQTDAHPTLHSLH